MHLRKMNDYNKQASDYIFRANNANIPGDTIDLHGQFVDEAEDILRIRIQAAQQQNQSHLHVIVGKGNHSLDHVQKIKPAVERLCQELGLTYRTEGNEGRMYIELKPGGGYGYSDQAPPPLPGQFGQQYGQGHGYGGGYPGQQQQQQQQDETEELVKAGFNCLRGCCTVM
jgi:Smr domain